MLLHFMGTPLRSGTKTCSTPHTVTLCAIEPHVGRRSNSRSLLLLVALNLTASITR